MKDLIVDMLAQKGSGRSFVELSEIDGFEGDLCFGDADKNIFYWFNISHEAIDALNELRREEKIELVSTSILVYYADGRVPSVDLAKQDRKYKNPRWLPCAINKGKKFFKNK